MNNSAHPALRTIARLRISDRPRVSKYELDPSYSHYQENLVLGEEGAPAFMLEEIVDSSEPLNAVRNM